MSATDTPRVELVIPTHSAWNRRFRHNGGGDPESGGAALVLVICVLVMFQLFTIVSSFTHT
jgi:hypothetical protein